MSYPKQLSIIPALLTGLVLAPPVFAQVVFSENFRSPSTPGADGVAPCSTDPAAPGTYAFPVGWLLRNVDNRTPNAAVNYVNDVWEIREDIGTGQDVNNCVAYSTSWYAPAGTANDFMWSPLINVPAGAVLSWRGRALDSDFPDGYQVHVMPAASGPPSGGAGDIGNQLTGTTMVFSTSAEATVWTPHLVSLTAFAGQGVYIGFRNNSNDQFLLVIDDMQVAVGAPDLAAQMPTPILPYTRVPSALVYTPLLGVNAANVGSVELTNISGSAQLVQDGVDAGAPTIATPIESLAVGVIAAVPFGAVATTLSAPGEWSVRYNLTANQSEDPSMQPNNTITAPGVTVNASELARHTGDSTNALGIGAGNGGELGVQFTIPNTITFAGVRFALAAHDPMVDDGMGGMRPSDWAGNPITANLRAFDTVNNRPGALIDTTQAGVSAFEESSYTLAFSGGPQVLQAGTYVVTVNEPILPNFPQDGNVALLTHDARFQLGTTWVIWPTSPGGNWANFETFGFSVAPAITLLTTTDLLRDGFEAAVPPATTGTPRSGGDVTRRSALPQLSFSKPKAR